MLLVMATAAAGALLRIAEPVAPPKIPTAPSATAPIRPLDLPNFEFRGCHIGDDALAAFPYLNDPKKLNREPYCFNETTPSYLVCRDPTSYNSQRWGSWDISIGELPLYYIGFYVYDRKIAGMEFMVSVNLYDKARNMLVGKYGQPSTETLGSVQDLNGATFDDAVTNWRIKEGVLLLKKRSSEVDKSLVQFIATSATQQIEKAKAVSDGAEGKAVF